MILYRLIGGFGVALWMVSRFAYIAEAVPLAQRGRAAAMFGGTNRAGMFVGPVIGGVLAEQVGMEVALLSSAAAAGLALVLVMLPGDPEADFRPYVQRRSLMAGLLAAVRRKPWEITSASTAQFLIQCIRGGRTTLLPLYGSFVIGLDVDTVGVIVGVSSLIDMVFFLPRRTDNGSVRPQVRVRPGFRHAVGGNAVRCVFIRCNYPVPRRHA